MVPGLDALAATAAATFAVGGPPPNLSELLSNRGRRAVALIKPPLPLITDKPDANAGCGRSLACLLARQLDPETSLHGGRIPDAVGWIARQGGNRLTGADGARFRFIGFAG